MPVLRMPSPDQLPPTPSDKFFVVAMTVLVGVPCLALALALRALVLWLSSPGSPG